MRPDWIGYRASISVWCRLASDAVFGISSQNCYQYFRYQKNMENLFIRFFKQGFFVLDTRGPYKCSAVFLILVLMNTTANKAATPTIGANNKLT